jgi:hypothetical protein
MKERRKKKEFLFSIFMLKYKVRNEKKRTSNLYVPAATFNRGCSLLIRINSTEFKLLKLVESSIYV